MKGKSKSRHMYYLAIALVVVVGIAFGAAQAGALNLGTAPAGNPAPVQQVLQTVVDNAGEPADEVAEPEVKALLPMPLGPDANRSCESCHNDRAELIKTMTDPALNEQYPGLAADVPFVDNFYVDPTYTELPDSMMTAAAKSPIWDGCKTCHSSGSSFDPFPSDNWVPDSNPVKGPQNAWGTKSTNDTSNSCGKCHPTQADAFNKGIMGTHRGHLGAFNYNTVEIEGTNVESDFYFSPTGSRQAGNKGGGGNAGYSQSRLSCSTCHQGCSDCHLTGVDGNPISQAGDINIAKGAEGTETIWMDQTHSQQAPRVKAYVAQSLRRGGVSILELRKGYIPGVSRGVPYTQLEAGMDITTHKMVKPTTLEQGNTLAPQTQKQSIDFCWRCHFRSAAEFQGQWINDVPNPNYEQDTLAHLNAGMTCTDCHGEGELHGQTSAQNGVLSASFFGTTDTPDNPSHPGGNPRGQTAAWPITPNPVRVTCELCHTQEGKDKGPTGGEEFGNLVSPRYQVEAKVVKGTAKLDVPGKVSEMSHSNISCDVCHVQAQQNCWNCHIETAEEAGPTPLNSSGDALNQDVLPPIINVREAEGEPALSDRENALLKEAPARNDVATIVAAITFPGSANTVNKAPRYMGRNNQGLVSSMVHCPSTPPGVNSQPYNNPQPLNLDGGLFITKSGAYGQNGSVQDVTFAAAGAWYMEAGHSIARNPDGNGYTACYNCHADTVRLGKEPITYYRKNPWVMKSTGVPEAILPDSHFLDDRYHDANGSFNCKCHTSDAVVHNGTEAGPFPGH